MKIVRVCTQSLGFFCLAANLYAADVPTQQPAAKTGLISSRCMVKLSERYGEKDYRLNKFSTTDNEIAQLVYAAGMIFSGTWSFPDSRLNHPAMAFFGNFIALLRDPSLEVLRSRPVGELQPVLLEPMEIAHLIWESYRRGIICPNYKNPAHAKTGDVYLSALSIREHIRSGTIPSLVSFLDDAARRTQKEQAALELARQQPAPTGESTLPLSAPPVPPPPAPATVNPEETVVAVDKKNAPAPEQAGKTVATKAPKVAAAKGSSFDDLDPGEEKPKKHRKKQRKEEDYGTKDTPGKDPYGSIEFLSQK